MFRLLLKTDMKAQNQSRLTKKHITGSMVMTCPFVITSHGLIKILPVTLLSMVSGIISTNVEHILWQVYLEMLGTHFVRDIPVYTFYKSPIPWLINSQQLVLLPAARTAVHQPGHVQHTPCNNQHNNIRTQSNFRLIRRVYVKTVS